MHPQQAPTYKPDDSYYYQTHIWPVIEGDSIEMVADMTRQPLSRLRIWNDVAPFDSLEAGQALEYFSPRIYKRLPQRNLKRIQQQWSGISHDVVESQHTTIRPLPTSFSERIYFTTTTKLKEDDLTMYFPNTVWQEWLDLNTLAVDKAIPAGTTLQIPQRAKL